MANPNLVMKAAKLVLVAPLSVVMLWIVGWIMSILTSPFSSSVGAALALIATAIILTGAMMYRKGKESFIGDLPVILVVLAIAALLSTFSPMLRFAIEPSLPGIALGFSVVYFAEGIIGRFIK